jgi:hypothetical protein
MKVVSALEAVGRMCWIAERDVKVGEYYADVIGREIPCASAVVLIFSKHSDVSTQVKKEVALADQHQINVLPFRIEDALPTGGFAYQLATRQWINAFADWDKGLSDLVAALGLLNGADVAQHESSSVDGVTPAQPLLGQTAPPVAPVARKGLRVAAVSMAAVVACLAVGIFYQPAVQLILDRIAQWHNPQASAPAWTALPQGTNFYNAGSADIRVMAGAQANAQSITSIRPGGTLFLNGDPTPIEQRTIDGKVWLRFQTTSGQAYVTQDSLKEIGRPTSVAGTAVDK